LFNQILLWSLLVLPWFALIPLNEHDVKRFFPAGLFGALVLTIIFQIAENFKWWEIKENIFILSNTTSFVYGLFLVGTIIILYFTYHHFLLYMVTNFIVDAILSFGISKWYEHLNIYELDKINPFGVYLLTIVVAVMIYGYQKWQETVMVNH
jgi:hypothetical protein